VDVAVTATTILRRLEQLARSFGPGRAAAKLEALRGPERRRLRSAAALLRYHEALCFLRAYPDDSRVLAAVETALAGFEQRSDLRQRRAELVDSGIAGTAIRYRFYWPIARWLVERWPERLTLEWDDEIAARRIGRALPQLVTFAEAQALRQSDSDTRRLLSGLCGPGETDAAFLVRRIDAMPGDDFTREALHDGIDAPYCLAPGPDGPSRTLARYARAPTVFRATAPTRERPELRREIARRPQSVRAVSIAEGRRLVDMAREAMVTRSRDLEAFGHGDPRDVRLVDDGDGLQFACIGVLPARRQLLHATYGALTLRNGVPIGYIQVDALARSAALSYNTFETYRGGEAAWVFGRLLAMVRRLFGAASFSIEPYQLGHGNDEGIESGAWWFYAKLGFRPRDPEARRLARAETERLGRRPGARSGAETLRRLARWHVFLNLGDLPTSVPPPPWPVDRVVGRDLVRRAGADRERALAECSSEAQRVLGVPSLRGWSADQRLAWARWSPLVLAIDDLDEWDDDERKALVAIVRAKGGRRESEFVSRVDSHLKLTSALLRLARLS